MLKRKKPQIRARRRLVDVASSRRRIKRNSAVQAAHMQSWGPSLMGPGTMEQGSSQKPEFFVNLQFTEAKTRVIADFRTNNSPASRFPLPVLWGHTPSRADQEAPDRNARCP